MGFFIADAWAEGAPVAGEPSLLMNLLPLLAFVAIFYFLLWRPQSKRNKEQKELLGNLNKGDEVLLAGGMLGKITKVVDDYIVVEVANNIEIRFQKSAVSASLPKGTIKNI
ncbi:Sec-system component preprotein translocase subunit [gamma proteobacterium HdN1]|nr:Sec-system component preprotein translocase subunit [gamma proteobacterium HdN1]